MADTGFGYPAIVRERTLHHVQESHEAMANSILKQKKQFLYFAYGSCMDDERFKLHRVDGLFMDVFGCGLLHGYSFRFTRKAYEGGHANIVECTSSFGGTVEGKVYRIGQAALTYLHEREGV
ncbi:gamma-glutamylcyclotransferase [Fodinisporobacter ferrooxydans]|uniref:Gamma-glutamylcyclotransferase n=1 Tax=Fodinisporobacter ferrooxydans TaxID=2901836 RepID=A0ABY4CF06_9BACL|nr:gamma-glutamylcyclotransferase [Alicyclobacillaceae bacterium MYW30-H2]